MNTLLIMCFEFFKTGLLAVGGGLATLPFLQEMMNKYNWFTSEELANMIAISESTPGPIGVNMATYVGYKIAGIIGGVLASLSLVLPSLIVMVIVTSILEKFRKNKFVESIFYILRPVSVAMILSAILNVIISVLFINNTSLTFFEGFNYIAAIIIIALTFIYYKFNKIHPTLILLIGAILGIILPL